MCALNVCPHYAPPSAESQVILAHWPACLWAFVSEEGVEPRDPVTKFLQQPIWEGYVPAGQGMSWRQKARIPPEASMYDVYVICLYVSLNNIFGGSCEVNPANYVEHYVHCLMMLVGSAIWAFVIGSGCGIIATLNPERIEYRQTMDQVNYFARSRRLPPLSCRPNLIITFLPMQGGSELHLPVHPQVLVQQLFSRRILTVTHESLLQRFCRPMLTTSTRSLQKQTSMIRNDPFVKYRGDSRLRRVARSCDDGRCEP